MGCVDCNNNYIDPDNLLCQVIGGLFLCAL